MSSSFVASIGSQLSELSTVEMIALCVLAVVALHLTVTIVLERNKPAPKPPAPKAVIVPRAYSVSELAEHNGKGSDKSVWLSIKGKIYDVSSKPHFYGPGGPYGCFAGRDVTRAMALASTDEKEIANPSIADIDDLTTLREWIAMFEAKYDVVGWLEGTDAAPAPAKTD
jgi:membrane-associated progesterone receptor component